MARHHEKVVQALKKEISSIIHDELDDPRLGFVTINRVELTSDFRYAKIFYSVLGKEEDYQKTQLALSSALGFIRRLVAQRMRLRFTPEIIFREDRSTEYGIQIQQALDQVSQLSKSTEDKSNLSSEGKTKKTGKEGQGEPKKINRCSKKS